MLGVLISFIEERSVKRLATLIVLFPIADVAPYGIRALMKRIQAGE